MAKHFLKIRNWIYFSIAVTLGLIIISVEKVFKTSELKQRTVFSSTNVTALKTAILSRTDSIIVNLQGAENTSAVFNWMHLRKGPIGECYQDGLRAIGITDVGDIYIDTANNAAYAIVHRRCKDYYLFRLYKHYDAFRCRFDYVMTHDRFTSLRDSALLHNGIVFYPFQFASFPDDSILIKKKRKGYEVFLPASVRDSIDYHFPEKNKLSSVYYRIAQKISAQTRRSFTPEDVHYIYNFFRRNNYFDDILFSKEPQHSIGFLGGSVVGQIKCNKDTVADLIIYIDGSRWINAKILCFDPLNNAILWQRELAPTMNASDILIADIDEDRKEEIIFSTYSPYSAFDLNYYAYPDSFGLPSKSYFRIWNKDGTDKWINGKKCEWVNPEAFTKFYYAYTPESSSFFLGIYSYNYNPHYLMKYHIKTNTMDTLDIPTQSVNFVKIFGKKIIVINNNRNLDEGNITESYLLNPQGSVINQYKTAFPFVFEVNLISPLLLFGEYYLSTSHGLFNEKLVKVLDFQPNTSVISAFGNTLLLHTHYNALLSKQNIVYQTEVYESYTFERWFLYLLIAELFLLLFYYFTRYIVFQPINTGANSYIELYSVFNKMFFWIPQGNIRNVFKIPNHLSYTKETFFKLLRDLGGKPEPLLRRRFFGTRYEVYEIPSKDEWIIIQRIAHDIKNRMLTIGINLESLEECLPNCPKAKDHRFLYSIKEHIEGVSEIAMKLSRFSHLERLQAETVEMESFLKQWIDRYLNHPQMGLIKTEMHLPGLRAHLDIKLFEMALCNLLDNALDAVNEKQWVNIEARKDGDIAFIRISNPAQIKQEEFKRFWELGYSTKTNGSGLGIPIAKQIVEKHQGEMTIDYADGIFSVTIKVKLLETV